MRDLLRRGADRLVDAAIRRQLSAGPDRRLLADDGRVRVLVAGTGTPETGAARAQACTLVAAGGRLFVFDAGEGATASLVAAGVDVPSVTRVFLTHFHSDHLNGLGTLVSAGWIWGRREPVRVTGPPGAREVVDGINATYRLDHGYRSGHMGAVQGRAAAAAVVAEHHLGDGPTRVYDEDGVTIDAVPVDHEPVEPACGYVLAHAGKRVFVSGDTRVTPRTLPAMRDADVVVHEAYATHLVRRALPVMRSLGMHHEAEVAERTIPYHADTIELARQAQAAGVRHLVLTHLIPYPANPVARRLFVAGMRAEYDGRLTLGRDGLVVEA